MRLSAPPRVEAGSRSPGSEVDRGSRSKGEGREVVTVGGKVGASADAVKAGTSTVRRKVKASAAGGKIAISATRGGKEGASIRGLNTAIRKTTALPPPLCGVCGQTVKSWSHVLICDG